MIALVAALLPLRAQEIYSVETCPAQNTGKAMNVSWAADTAIHHSHVLYTLKSDKLWRHAKRVDPEQYLCTTFDSIYSQIPVVGNVWERHVFWKCGATLNGLKKDTEYMYRIMTGDRTTGSMTHYFKTAGAKRWSAAIISDFHTWNPLPDRLTAAMTMIDTIEAVDKSIDWVLHLGDVIAWGGSYSYWQRLYREPNFHDFMWAGVNGNHDNMSRKYELTNKYFRDANHYPRNGYEGEMGVCYYFKYGDALFIMLNNEDMRSDSALRVAQQWFRQVVAKEKARYIIACEHYQWFDGPTGKDSQYGRWKDVFDECGVDLALSGNSHIYNRTNALYRGVETDGTKGTVYVQSASSDNERGRDPGTLTHNRDIIKKHWAQGVHTVSGMLLKVDEKCMTVTLYDRHGTLIDQVKILAKR